jgi:hypothetical protein
MKEENIVFEDVFSKLPKTPVIQPEVEKEYTSLYEELEDRCNPNYFLPPNDYDKNKAKVAHNIYLRLENVKSNIEEQKQLRHQAIVELEIRFNSHALRDKLKNYICPTKYIRTEKFDLANEMYSLVIEKGEDIEALEKIQTIIENKLLNDTILKIEEREREEIEERERKRIRKDKKNTIILIILLFAIPIIIIALVEILKNQ